MGTSRAQVTYELSVTQQSRLPSPDVTDCTSVQEEFVRNGYRGIAVSNRSLTTN